MKFLTGQQQQSPQVLKDIGIINDSDKSLIIDKNKLRKDTFKN